jgi:hypothetical protein
MTMHRIDNASAATSQPLLKPQGPQGYFTEGNVTIGQTPTILEADWLNNVQEELVNIVHKGGLTLDKTNNAQLLQALSALFTGAFRQITTTQDLLVPPWATQVGVRLVGSGGGGAHCQSDGTNYRAGGGAGSGAYAEAQRPCVAGELLHVIVGIGGGTEANGQATSIASTTGTGWTVSAGGGAASGYSAPNNSPGGPGGTASGGDMNSSGAFGGDGMAAGNFASTGYGGNGPWGGGSRAANGDTNMAVVNGSGPGAGGAGQYDTANRNTYFPGGTGASGMIQYRFLP